MPSRRLLAPRPLLLAVFAAGLAASGARAAPASAPPAVYADAKQLLAALIAIDTTPEGSTAPAARLLADYLRAAGFGDDELWIGGPRAERSNLVARLRGSGKHRAKPVLFLSHLDVVRARREDWTVPPFQLTEQGGYLYGRGTLDIKDEVVDLVVNLARLKRSRVLLSRDIVLALTADEEEGDANGVEWLLANRRELFDAASVINTDAGGLQLQNGRLLRMPVQTSEKVYLSFELETRSAGGHSALPTRENAIYRLAAALGRLDGFAFPVALSATTRRYFEGLAADATGELSAAFRGVLAHPPEPAAVEKLSSIPWYNAALRTVCSPTLLSAGQAENALPQRATATLQCRLLPGDDPTAVRETVIAQLADPSVSVKPKGTPLLAPESPIDPGLFRAVEEVTQSCWPGVPVLPVMDPWASDGALLRRAGIPVYGISGVYFDVDDVRSHGQDERIASAAFAQGLEFMHRLMRRLALASGSD